jgi:UDP-N-acetylglucosamine 2-epimerase (non-hydrolysing)
MKVMTVLGTRPEIIRLSLIIPLLDGLCDHTVVHTGQNYDRTLNDIFFGELGLRQPDHVLDSRSGTLMGQVSKILVGCEELMTRQRPDRLLILGDTNSALSAIVAKRLGIPVYHMEAGNRCFDDRVPEEVNRRIVDHCSDVLLPYTERSRANLLREGIEGRRIYVTGNPIREVLDHFEPGIAASTALDTLAVSPQKYFLVTLHRAENVDVPERLSHYLEALYQLGETYRMPVICSLHPRTRSQLERQGKQLDGSRIRAVEPFGLFDFVHLEKNAFCVLSDSGTVQEECSIFNVPNVTLRDVTERPETMEAGSNFITGADPESILRAVRAVTDKAYDWRPPLEYTTPHVSKTVANILLSYRHS